MSTLVEKLSKVQKELKAPKNQRNNFGNYNYRSCEDILEAVKPHLDGTSVTVSDKIVVVNAGEKARVYVEATVTFTDGTEKIEVTASARESETKKGMDDAQITGSASSYARKYALNGLFLIDDTKDSDATNTHGKGESVKSPVKTKAKVVSKNSFRDSKKPDVVVETVDDEEL
jgi:hypothetical protein